MTYVRYGAELTREGLHDLGLGDIDPADVQRLDSVEHIGDLQRVGRRSADRSLDPAHLDGFLLR